MDALDHLIRRMLRSDEEPMQLQVTDDFWTLFPNALIGVVVARDIDNTGANEAATAQLREAEAHVRNVFATGAITEHPHIAVWRDAYKRFGSKPKEYPSSIENLVRRISKGYTLPHINQLVDVYNGVSLRHVLPVGGEDLDQIDGDVLLTVAGAAEAPVQLLGEAEARAPYAGEVIYKDNAGAICRRWNWREADRTKLTQQTRNAVLVIEAVPPIGRDLIEQAVQELAARVQEYCGGQVRTALLDRTSAGVDLGAA